MLRLKFIIAYDYLTDIGALGTPKQSIIVTGGTGLLGGYLVDVLKDDYEVTSISRHASRQEKGLSVDITRKHQVEELLKHVGPGVVVHAAANTNVDACETDRNLAWKVNVDGTANVAKACVNARARMILVSTDYVFNGEVGNYVETDTPDPVNFYGQTKLEAERIVAAILSDSLIVRTAVLYGWHNAKRNFVTWTLERLRRSETIKVAEDHISSPTSARNLANAIRAAIDRKSNGILHVAGSERISRYGFAVKVAKTFGLDAASIVPVKMTKLGWVARRPRDSSLGVERAREELGIGMFDVDSGLKEMAEHQP